MFKKIDLLRWMLGECLEAAVGRWRALNALPGHERYVLWILSRPRPARRSRLAEFLGRGKTPSASIEVRWNPQLEDWLIYGGCEERNPPDRGSKDGAIEGARRYLRNRSGGEILVIDETGEVVENIQVRAKLLRPLVSLCRR